MKEGWPVQSEQKQAEYGHLPSQHSVARRFCGDGRGFGLRKRVHGSECLN
jgi:hypothetical protein